MDMRPSSYQALLKILLDPCEKTDDALPYMEPFTPESVSLQPSHSEMKQADLFSSISNFDFNAATYYPSPNAAKKSSSHVLKKQRVQVEKSPVGVEKDSRSTTRGVESEKEFTVQKQEERDVVDRDAKSLVGRKRKVGRPQGLEKRARCR